MVTLYIHAHMGSKLDEGVQKILSAGGQLHKTRDINSDQLLQN